MDTDAHDLNLIFKLRDLSFLCVCLHVRKLANKTGKTYKEVLRCSVLQCVAVCCCALHCVAVCCGVLQYVAVRCSVLQCVAVRCSVLQCVAVCCSVLQCVAVCVAVCCSVLQCVAVRCSALIKETDKTQKETCQYVRRLCKTDLLKC